MATIKSIKRSNGVAGQFAYDVTFEDREPLGFVSNTYGGGIFMVTATMQTQVNSPERFGDSLTSEWVHKFVAGLR